MDMKQEFFDGLSFIGSSHTKTRYTKDVCVRIHSGNRFALAFRNKIDEAIGEGDRIEFAIYKNRIVFRKIENGLKLYENHEKGGSVTKYIKASAGNYEDALRHFVGDHELKYDPFYEYYYIEA